MRFLNCFVYNLCVLNGIPFTVLALCDVVACGVYSWAHGDSLKF